MKERSAQEIVDATRTGKLYDGTSLNPETEEVNKTEENKMSDTQVKPEVPTQEPAQEIPAAPLPAVPKKPAVKKPKVKEVPVTTIPEAPVTVDPATELQAAEPVEKVAKVKEPKPPKEKKESGAVSPRLTRFILSFISSAEGNMARTVDVGCAGMHSADAVRKPMLADESFPPSRYTAWACTPCTKLASQGLLERILIESGQESGRSMIAFYRVTAEGTIWLEQNQAPVADNPA